MSENKKRKFQTNRYCLLKGQSLSTLDHNSHSLLSCSLLKVLQTTKDFEIFSKEENSKMKTIFTFVAFVFACSLLLASFEEVESVGFIIEIGRPPAKRTSYRKSNKVKKNLSKSKRSHGNRMLKHQMKKVMRSLKKAQQREAILRRMLQSVSLIVDLRFSHSDVKIV